MSDNTIEHWGGRQAAELVGITYRQLDYWARTDLVRPSVTDAQGSGSRRRYNYRDLLELRTIKNLLDAGIRLESVRAAFGYLREQLGQDIASANLVISNGNAVLARSDGELIDLIRRRGQGVLNVLPLADVKEEIDNAIVLLRVPDADSGTDPKGVTDPTVAGPTDEHPDHPELAAGG